MQAGSTLELVVNEQQLQNMSQIDLSHANGNGQQVNARQQQHSSSLLNIKQWPGRCKESFAAKIDEAKSESSSTSEFILSLLRLFSGTAVWALCFFCTIIMPIFLFLAGLLSLEDCSARPSLPYLVLAVGFTMSASNLFNLGLALDLPILSNQSMLSSDIKNTIASIINMIFNCIVAFLYILCAYKVYAISAIQTNLDNADEGNADHQLACNPFLYHFTFWFVTLTLAMFALLITVGGVFFAYNQYRLAIIRGSTPRSQEQQQQQQQPTQTSNINTNPASAF